MIESGTTLRNRVLSDQANPPRIALPSINDFPPDLAARPTWLVWSLEWAEDKHDPSKGTWTKVPRIVANGRAIKGGHDQLENLVPLKEALEVATTLTGSDAAGRWGVGLGCPPGGGGGVDIDNVFSEGGEFLSPEIEALIDRVGENVYWERSVSGTGLHALGLHFECDFPEKKFNLGNGVSAQLFNGRGFLATTGQRIPGGGMEISHLKALADELYELRLKKNVPAKTPEPKLVKPAAKSNREKYATFADLWADDLWKYLATLPASVAGSGGHDALFRVACEITRDWGAGRDAALEPIGKALFEKWNRENASPPEDEYQINHKWKSALAKANDPIQGEDFYQQKQKVWDEFYSPKSPNKTKANQASVEVVRPVDPTQSFYSVGSACKPMTAIKWILPKMIPRGFFGLCDAWPGTGKSQFLASLVAGVTVGFRESPIPGAKVCDPENAVWITCEEEDSKIAERHRRCGGDDDRILIVNGIPTKDENGEIIKRYFSAPTDYRPLEDLLRTKRPSLCILDSMDGLIDPGKSTIDNQKMRCVLGRLRQFGEDYNCTFVMIRHFTKASLSRSGPSMTKGSGGMAIMGLARFGLVMEKHPDDVKKNRQASIAASGTGMRPEKIPVRTVVFVSKANDFKDGGSIVFKKTVDDSGLCPETGEPIEISVPEFEGDHVEYTFNEEDFEQSFQRSAEHAERKGSRGPAGQIKEAAINDLREALETNGGSIPGRDIMTIMRGYGHSEATTRRARDEMKHCGEIQKTHVLKDDGVKVLHWELVKPEQQVGE